METDARIAQLELQRNALYAQISGPMSQLMFLEGQLLVLRELQEEEKKLREEAKKQALANSSQPGPAETNT